MPVERIDWGRLQGDDMHVLRGHASRRLDQILFVKEVGGGWSSMDSPPANVDPPRFNPQFDGAPSSHGITVDTLTGVVNAVAPPPAGPRLQNFIIVAEVNDTSPGGILHTIKIRIQLHNSITRVWLTPNPFTGHEDANNVHLTVLAEFDDGIVGDISNWSELDWRSSAPADIDVSSTLGELELKHAGTSATISVEVRIPPFPTPPSLNADARVDCIANWSAPTVVEWVDGAGAGKRDDVTNILFLPDGFEAGERPLFRRLVRNIVRQLGRWRSTRPFDLLNDSINYWMAFVPSPKAGVNVLPEVAQHRRRGTRVRAQPIKFPEEPPAGAATWTLEQLIHEVGLPVPGDDPPGRPLTGAGGKLPDWQTLYGPKVTEVRVRGVYPQWLRLRDRTLVNERDSAFGLAFGNRPRADRTFVPRSVSFNRRRMDDADFDRFLRNLHYKGTTIGDKLWSTGDAPGATRGKDRGLVCFIARENRSGGSNRGDYYTSSLRGHREFILMVSGAGPELEIVPSSIPTKASATLVSRVAHESAHSFGLDDEYGGLLNLPASRIPNTRERGNVQPRDELTVPGPNLNGDKIKWLWPRIEKAGVLAAKPSPAGGNSFEIELQPGQAAQFKVDDIVRLRKRPLLQNPTASFRLKVTVAAAPPPALGDSITVEQIEGLPVLVNRDDFPEGSVLIAPVRSPGPPAPGDDLPLVAPIIRAHITTTGGPLNAPPPTAANPAAPLRACVADPKTMQRATNRPAGLRKGRPKYTAWIVGLYEGGDSHDCGIYHPTGVCLMRAKLVPGTRTIYSFCPVCRYVIVDRLDPTKHAEIDADYAKRYAEP